MIGQVSTVNPQDEEALDHREADSFLNMSGDGIQEEEVQIGQRSNDGQGVQEVYKSH
jgi:hypothetical protein